MTLREDRGFVIYRAVLRMEDQIGHQPVSLDNLVEVARGENFAFHCAQHEKSVRRALQMAHGYRLRLQRLEGNSVAVINRPAIGYVELMSTCLVWAILRLRLRRLLRRQSPTFTIHLCGAAIPLGCRSPSGKFHILQEAFLGPSAPNAESPYFRCVARPGTPE